jgi:hypothetical protein
MAHLGTVTETNPRENPNATTSLDGPRREPAADCHGSFDSVASSSSTVSSKSGDSFSTVLEEAEDAHLTIEEAVKYLKNVLCTEMNPTDGTSLKTSIVDAQGEMTMVTHEQPWTTVTRHRTMHITAEQRPPRLESSKVDADHASDSMTIRSRTGFLVWINSCLVYFLSKKQTSVETSSFGQILAWMCMLACGGSGC